MPRPSTAAVRLLTGEREPVRLATTANIDVDGGGLLTIDGVVTEVGDRVLVKNQTDGSENGIRTASEGQWYRAADARTSRTLQKGTTVAVQEGAANAGKTFVFTSLDPQIGDDAITLAEWLPSAAQPLNANLTAIALLTTTAYGRALLELANGTALAALVDSFFLTPTEGNAAYQPLDTDLSAIAALATTAYGRSLLTSASVAALSATWVNLQTGTGAVSRTIQNKFAEVISVKDFGAVGDGTTTDTTAIQAAETYRASVGGELIFPAGTYKTAGITIGRVNGGGWRGLGARLIPTGNNVTFMTLSGAVLGAGQRDFVIQGLTFAANGSTGISAVVEVKPYCTVIRNIATENLKYVCSFTGDASTAQYGGITIDGVNQLGTGEWNFSAADDVNYFFNVNVSNVNQTGLVADNWATATPDAAMFRFKRAVLCNVSNVNALYLAGNGDGVLLVGDCQGTFFGNAVFAFPATGIRSIVDTSGNCPNYVFATNFAVDTPQVSGIVTNGNEFAWKLVSINVTNGAQKSNTGPAVSFAAGNSDINLDGATITNNYRTGVSVTLGAKVNISNLKATGNNVVAGAFVDIDLGGSTQANVVLSGKNTIGTINAVGQVIKDGRTTLPVFPGAGTFAASVAQFYTDGTYGAVLSAGNGATNDWILASAGGATLIAVPHGTSDLQIGGGIGIGTVGLATAATGAAYATFAAGTATVSTAKFTAGVVKTTAAAGDWEYDGKALYFAHVASSRGVVAAKQIATVQGSPVALTNNIVTPQSIFASANDALTVAAATTYRFRARLTFNTGATSHTTGFSFGGTATFTACDYTSMATSSVANTLATPQMVRINFATSAALTAASTAATTDIILEGIIRVNAGGTIIPQVTFSAGPTGTCETAVDSYFELEPIGSNTVAAVGNWA